MSLSIASTASGLPEGDRPPVPAIALEREPLTPRRSVGSAGMELSSLVGRDLGQVTFPIERGKLRELARALHDEDPAWHEPEAARAAGFGGVPTPPTATVLAAHWTEGGLVGYALALGMDVRRLLHGEAAWTYERPVRLGDELTASTVVVDARRRDGKRGGTMTLLAIETTFVDQDGRLVARLRDTMIETEG